MFRWSVSASLGQAHQAWRLPSASFCLEGNIASCKQFSLNLLMTKAVISFVDASFPATLQNLPRYGLAEWDQRCGEVQFELWNSRSRQPRDVKKNWLEMWKTDFRRRSTSGRVSRKRPPRRRRSGTSSAAAITGKLAFRQSQREGHQSHKRTCGFRFLENQRRQKAITSYFCVERQEICTCAQTRSGR